MITSLERSVLDVISVADLVEVTRSLVRAPGENPPGEEAATVAALAAACAERGLPVTATTVQPGRSNLSAKVAGGNGPGLLLLGHTDVVPVGEGWTVDPFGGLVRDGLIYGRGATDMKGGLAACVVAMAALSAAGVPLSGPVELAALVDEEDTGLGIRRFVAGPEASYLGCVVAEPTDLQTIVGARGDSYVRITVTGRAAHAGNPSDGANAIYGATAIVAELERMHAELAAAPHPLVGPATWSVGRIDGGTGASIVPDHCIVDADRRTLPGESEAAMLAELSERIDGLRLADRGLSVELTMPMGMPGFETAVDDLLVKTSDGALADADGPGLPLGGWTAACDGGFVARDLDVPVVVLGPGSVTGQAHRADESVPVDELVIAARTYALTALRLLT
jgi:acetylornithine deacetylase/succinyl-diaminopimelate desuccinylase family protein